jgi:hypothetical protein
MAQGNKFGIKLNLYSSYNNFPMIVIISKQQIILFISSMFLIFKEAVEENEFDINLNLCSSFYDNFPLVVIISKHKIIYLFVLI